jgi:hypothetical protein
LTKENAKYKCAETGARIREEEEKREEGTKTTKKVS